MVPHVFGADLRSVALFSLGCLAGCAISKLYSVMVVGSFGKEVSLCEERTRKSHSKIASHGS